MKTKKEKILILDETMEIKEEKEVKKEKRRKKQ